MDCGVALVDGAVAFGLDARDGVAQRGSARAQLGTPASRHNLRLAPNLVDGEVDQRLFELVRKKEERKEKKRKK